MSIVSVKLIELASSTIRQRAKTLLDHRAKLGQRATLDNAAGIKQSKKLRNLFKLNPIEKKAKTNDNCSKLPARDPHHTSVNSTLAS